MFLFIWDCCLALARKSLPLLKSQQIAQRTISSQVRLMFITVLLAIGACSVEPPTPISNNISDNSTSTSSPESIFFPKQELVNGEWIRMTGEVTGELIEVNGCLRLNASHDDASYLIVWPPDYALDSTDNVVRIRNEIGQIVGRVGEVVHMGGGEGGALEGVASVNEQLLQEIPSECSGPYWISGGIISSPVDQSE